MELDTKHTLIEIGKRMELDAENTLIEVGQRMELSEEDTLIEVRPKKNQMHKKQHSYIRIHKKIN